MEKSDTSNNLISADGPEPQMDKEEIEEIKKKATMLFLQGKRSIYIRDYQGALVALSESCMLFNQIYPEYDDALADPYFYYGKALLEVGRSETDVLGDQVQDDNDEDEDDDDDFDEAEDCNTKNDEEQPSGSKVGENSESIENGAASTSGNASSSEPTASVSKETFEDGASKDTTDDENGDINDLQLSWEYLELAKLIYLKKADTCKETAIKLAETYLCLGENGLESENYSTAIDDIKRALELQKKHLKEEDRRLAETLYQLGVAHSLDQNYDEAIDSFNKAIEQLRKKIASLEIRKKNGDAKTEDEEKDAFYTMDGEIHEIEGVITDIEEKIKDMMESKNKVKAELIKQVVGDTKPSTSQASQSQSVQPESSSASTSSSTPANDISHLIKRKRKNEENGGGEEKKLKAEN